MTTRGRIALGVAVLAGILIAASVPAGGTELPQRSGAKARIAREVTVDKLEIEHDSLASAPYRAHFGRTDLYIPTFFEPKSGKFDLIVHFHGLAAAQESNIERARINAVVATLNIG